MGSLRIADRAHPVVPVGSGRSERDDPKSTMVCADGDVAIYGHEVLWPRGNLLLMGECRLGSKRLIYRSSDSRRSVWLRPGSYSLNGELALYQKH